MTTAQRLREEGRAVGRAEGREEGRAEGRVSALARVLLRQLRLKFGPVDPTVRAQVESADEAQLTGWTDRILTADAVDAVFEETSPLE